MYSITLAKYPHWVDFDAAEPKLMKGFTFLPRQSGQNGWVKDYEVYVSQDASRGVSLYAKALSLPMPSSSASCSASPSRHVTFVSVRSTSRMARTSPQAQSSR